MKDLIKQILADIVFSGLILYGISGVGWAKNIIIGYLIVMCGICVPILIFVFLGYAIKCERIGVTPDFSKPETKSSIRRKLSLAFDFLNFTALCAGGMFVSAVAYAFLFCVSEIFVLDYSKKFEDLKK